MAIKHWGKMERVPVEVEPVLFEMEGFDPIVMQPGRTAILQGQGGKTWWQMTKGIKIKPGQWFIAVRDDGYIMCCEADPNTIMLFDIDFWQIDSELPREKIFCQKWTGERVEPWPASPDQ